MKSYLLELLLACIATLDWNNDGINRLSAYTNVALTIAQFNSNNPHAYTQVCDNVNKICDEINITCIVENKTSDKGKPYTKVDKACAKLNKTCDTINKTCNKN